MSNDTTIIPDGSNMQDIFVPYAVRHQFTEAVNTDETSIPSNPSFSRHEWGACKYEWTGYIYIAETVQNANIQIGADDLGEFSIDAFPDKKATVDRPNPGPAGGGQYYMGSAVELGIMYKGYYRVKISYTNIEYTASRNAARCEVCLNGSRVKFGALRAVNLMPKDKAEAIKKGYTGSYIPAEQIEQNPASDPRGPVDYIGAPGRENFWGKFNLPEAAYQKALADEPCASRLSVALNRAGYRIGAYMINGNQVSDNMQTIGSDLIVLNPEAPSDTPDASWGKHILKSAANMKRFLREKIACTAPDYYEGGAQYDSYEQDKMGDIVIFASGGHAGLTVDGNLHVAASMPKGDVWVLHRECWDEPRK
ncbi:hypothetical protein [Akkermansia glycaniphila]|uniref:Uncharacterized protein n=1 Tax=Akkermansia glycaniphila TaxID=1679444 RepID=A0A1C7PCZ0_9BACT|nr:hypothetical protein [Akkermansia glycaniphila]OCA03433.1 hypothetical protein AC781_05000 [Akkermansia glycaniphila]SEH90680.1 Hypothetical protein PYTT_1602 [Akkermansia glycaniphila]